jgi:hypothetical protein
VRTLTRVRFWLVVFFLGLALSGVTAFPLVWETGLAADALHAVPAPSALVTWIDRVHVALSAADRDAPFLAYGTDWLAFAHLAIAVAFWGPLRDPVRNVWVIQFGMIACVGIVPLALIAGAARGIPWWWQLIDISFGVGGIVPLLLAYRGVRLLERGAAEALAGRPTTSVAVGA